MEIIRTVAGIREQVSAWRREGLSVGLVPTMGCLHEGHLALVRKACEEADRVVVSIYVNPTQFGPGEDFETYPRDEAGDCAAASDAGAHVAFIPPCREIYPEGAETFVECERLPRHLCGRSRPTHFRGVTTVVCKLFCAVQPDLAVFGEKDYQQLQVLRRMTGDLLLPVRIVGLPTVREDDGLAMSSRNIYLSADERKRAAAIRRSLLAARSAVQAGQADSGVLVEQVSRALVEAGGGIDYIEVVEPFGLEPLKKIDGPAHMAVAVRFGPARLIDNIRLRD